MGQIRLNTEAKTEFGPPSSDRALYSDKACSFNQSERVLYRNFVINIYKSSDRTYSIRYVTLVAQMVGTEALSTVVCSPVSWALHVCLCCV